MKVKKIFLCFVLLVTWINASGADNYQLSTSEDGAIYRVNTNTGEVLLIENDRMTSVKKSKVTKLNIGEFYEDETGSIMKYIGKLKFEEDHSYLWK